MQNNKVLVNWGPASNSSSEEPPVQKTTSMSSHYGDNTVSHNESATVKSSEKVPAKQGQDIMHEFLEVKDKKPVKQCELILSSLPAKMC